MTLAGELKTREHPAWVKLLILGVLILLNVVSTAAYGVLAKVTQDTYGNKNAAFLNLASDIMAALMALVFVIVGVRTGKAQFRWLFGRDCFRNRAVRQLMSIAVLCAVCNFIWALTSVATPATVQALLSLTIVPFAMVLSMLLFQKSYDWWFKSGAALVVLGAFVGSRFTPGSTIADETGQAGHVPWAIYAVYAFANFPYAYQYVLTEQFFKEGGGIWELETYTGWIEIVFSLALSPLQAYFLGLLGEKAEEFSFSDGFQCLLGRDETCGLGPTPFILFLVYCLSSVFNDACYLLLTKYGSAAFMTVADGFSVPLVALFMALPLLGKFQESFNVMNVFGTILCSAGMVLWAKGEAKEEQREKEYHRVTVVRQGSELIKYDLGAGETLLDGSAESSDADDELDGDITSPRRTNREGFALIVEE